MITMWVESGTRNENKYTKKNGEDGEDGEDGERCSDLVQMHSQSHDICIQGGCGLVVLRSPFS